MRCQIYEICPEIGQNVHFWPLFVLWGVLLDFSGFLRKNILSVPQLHPPIVYVYQIAELWDKFQVFDLCGALNVVFGCCLFFAKF